MSPELERLVWAALFILSFAVGVGLTFGLIDSWLDDR
jgi:hypothetical protein